MLETQMRCPFRLVWRVFHLIQRDRDGSSLGVGGVWAELLRGDGSLYPLADAG